MRTAPPPHESRTPRDSQRARVYRAEDAWATRLDAARLGAPLATVAGSAVLLPAERRFGSMDAAADYVARVLAMAEVHAVVGPVPPPVLRRRRGARAAHWEPPGTIAVPVPVHGQPWALRETVLLHELAHHVHALAHPVPELAHPVAKSAQAVPALAHPVPELAHGVPELAHSVAGCADRPSVRARGHGAPFPALVLLLVDAALGTEAAFALRVEYGDHRVETGRW